MHDDAQAAPALEAYQHTRRIERLNGGTLNALECIRSAVLPLGPADDHVDLPDRRDALRCVRRGRRTVPAG